MNIVWTALFVLVSLVALYLIVTRNKVPIFLYDPLDVMRADEWKQGRQIRRELEERKNGKISIAEFYEVMGQLEELELVTHRIIERTIDGTKVEQYEYRLTERGKRREVDDPTPEPPAITQPLASARVVFSIIQ